MSGTSSPHGGGGFNSSENKYEGFDNSDHAAAATGGYQRAPSSNGAGSANVQSQGDWNDWNNDSYNGSTAS